MPKKLPGLLLIFFLLLSLPFLVKFTQTVQQFFITARGEPANLVVDTQNFQGWLYQPWQALAQGGEESDPRTLEPVINQIRQLSPQYIRLDHLYDFYQVVNRGSDADLVFDWTKLDQVVSSIRRSGALPFFSLSYTPPVISTDGNITGQPANWLEWQTVIQRTIEHYSGINDQNLNAVYYEVYNEPDLFGGWQIGGQKDYRLLYYYAQQGARQAANVNAFKIGGPALTYLRQPWLRNFLDYVSANDLRLDFISWHIYSPQISRFLNDFQTLDKILQQDPQFTFKEVVISEWGSDSQNSSWHDGRFDAAHTVAVSRQLLGNVTYAFSFEIKDGPSPEGKKFWGRWGLLTHEKFGVEAKPRFFALQLLNRLGDQRLKLDGEGTWVTGLAAKKDRSFQLLLVNFDPQSRHQESVPIQFLNLLPGDYQYRQVSIGGQNLNQTITVAADQSSFEDLLFLPENSVFLLELTPLF